jgi:hypothetical protein
VNQTTASGIESDTAGLGLAECPCAVAGMAACVQGLCANCGGPDSPPGCGPTGIDAGPPGRCADIEVGDYETTCQHASDCTLIYSGEFCSGDCLCPNATINQSGYSQYEEAIAGIPGGDCACPGVPDPVCAQGRCALAAGG